MWVSARLHWLSAGERARNSFRTAQGSTAPGAHLLPQPHCPCIPAPCRTSHNRGSDNPHRSWKHRAPRCSAGPTSASHMQPIAALQDPASRSGCLRDPSRLMEHSRHNSPRGRDEFAELLGLCAEHMLRHKPLAN